MRPANARHPDIVVPIALHRTHEAVCCAPWFVLDTEYRPWPASYRPLINGQEAFGAVHKAIAEAQRSVDIICWGFQPSMHFIRDGSDDRCIGELLKEKARQGVQVRILGWEMPLNAAGMAGEANLPGKGGLADRAGQTASDEQYAYDRRWFEQYSVADGKAAGLVDAPIHCSSAAVSACPNVRKLLTSSSSIALTLICPGAPSSPCAAR